MITVSLCMIVKNEEDVLAAALSSAKSLVDEIIVVDTGSTDKTKEIAGEYTDLVYDFEWIEDFAAARNFAFSKATSNYCMWLDADDVIKENDKKIFMELKESLPESVNVVMAKYNTGFDSDGNVTFSYFRERLIKNNAGMLWKGAVHEVIEPVGETIYSEFAVTHKKIHPSDPKRNLRIFESEVKKGHALDPRQQFYYGRELYYNGQYKKAIRIFKRFLKQGLGWVENNIDACCHMAYCYYKLNRPDEALNAYFKTFSYDQPRAEVSCDIGYHFFNREQYKLAAYWYAIALTAERNDRRGGFVSTDCYGYIPCIQLCVCYSRMGNTQMAELFNEQAATFKPNSPAVSYNREYFKTLADEKPSEEALEEIGAKTKQPD